MKTEYIVNGVNVAQCEFHYKGEHTNEDWCIMKGYGEEYCDCKPNCNYKQFIRFVNERK